MKVQKFYKELFHQTLDFLKLRLHQVVHWKKKEKFNKLSSYTLKLHKLKHQQQMLFIIQAQYMKNRKKRRKPRQCLSNVSIYNKIILDLACIQQHYQLTRTNYKKLQNISDTLLKQILRMLPLILVQERYYTVQLRIYRFLLSIIILSSNMSQITLKLTVNQVYMCLNLNLLGMVYLEKGEL